MSGLKGFPWGVAPKTENGRSTGLIFRGRSNMSIWGHHQIEYHENPEQQDDCTHGGMTYDQHEGCHDVPDGLIRVEWFDDSSGHTYQNHRNHECNRHMNWCYQVIIWRDCDHGYLQSCPEQHDPCEGSHHPKKAKHRQNHTKTMFALDHGILVFNQVGEICQEHYRHHRGNHFIDVHVPSFRCPWWIHTTFFRASQYPI